MRVHVAALASLVWLLACSDSDRSAASPTSTAGSGGVAGSGGMDGAGAAGGGGGGDCGQFPPVTDGAYGMAGTFETQELIAGPLDAFTIVQPVALGNDGLLHPIVVFAVGTGGTPSSYSVLLQRIASHGFVVIAGDDGDQAAGEQALEGLNWLIAQNGEATSAWSGKLDSARIGAVGHSQGGNAVIHAALKEPAVSAVAPIFPGWGALGGVGKADESALTAATFYTCGGIDSIVPEEQCADRYANTNATAFTAVLIGATHFAPNLNTLLSLELRRWLIAFLRAELMDDCDAYQLFRGDPFALAEDGDWRDVARKNL